MVVVDGGVLVDLVELDVVLVMVVDGVVVGGGVVVVADIVVVDEDAVVVVVANCVVEVVGGVVAGDVDSASVARLGGWQVGQTAGLWIVCSRSTTKATQPTWLLVATSRPEPFRKSLAPVPAALRVSLDVTKSQAAKRRSRRSKGSATAGLSPTSSVARPFGCVRRPARWKQRARSV